ncbi:MAG: ATP-binding protein [Anaerolineae bacterium]
MEQRLVAFSKTPVEEELVGRVAWQIQLRWFAAAGVLVAAWFATSLLDIPLPSGSLYAVGLAILLYNAAFWFYLRQLKRQSASEATVFDRFAKVQTGLDWLAMILLVHFSGGIESPLLFYFFFHLIIASILLSPRACYVFATLAALAVAGLALLEHSGLIPHVPLGFVGPGLYRDGLYIAGVLFFFSTALFIAVYLATSVTINLRRKDKALLDLQRQLASAYQRIQTLYDITRTVTSTLNLEEVLSLVAKLATDEMEVKACSVGLLSDDGRMLETVSAYGLSDGFLASGPVEIKANTLTRQTLAAGQPAIVSDVAADPRLEEAPQLQAEGIRSVLCVPLEIRGKAEGLICVYDSAPGRFGERDADFLSALASEAATAVINARAYHALEMADRAKSDFVRMVTHELRSPLAAVQSMLKLMDQGYVGPLSDQQQDLIQRSQRRIQFLLALVRDLLELAAGKMEQIKGEKKEVALGELIRKAAEMMQATATEKGLDYQVDIRDEPLVLVGVEEGLERAFTNLINNAVKYTPPGGSVAVRAWQEDGSIRVEVSDTGIGIPAEALPRLFSEFYRAKNAKAIEMEGTGLGLAIVKDVIEQHGGEITVQSVEGEGSTFSVKLPQRPSQAVPGTG